MFNGVPLENLYSTICFCRRCYNAIALGEYEGVRQFALDDDFLQHSRCVLLAFLACTCLTLMLCFSALNEKRARIQLAKC